MIWIVSMNISTDKVHCSPYGLTKHGLLILIQSCPFVNLAHLSLVQTVKSPKGFSGKKLPKGVPEGLITQGTSRGQIFQTIPRDFSLFVRFWISKTEEDAAQSCLMGLSGETVSLNLLKSDSVKLRLRWLKNKVCIIFNYLMAMIFCCVQYSIY